MEDYEAFHRSVKKVLANELKEDNDATLELMSMIQEQIDELDKKLKEFKSVPDVSEAVLERHAEIVAKIKQLKDEIKSDKTFIANIVVKAETFLAFSNILSYAI